MSIITLLTVLFMLITGTSKSESLDSLSAQFEQTILVTEDGYESLTPYEL